MKTVNLGANYEHRVTLRLNESQYNFLIDVSKILDVSPSEYIRMVINSGMVASQNNDFMKGLVGTNENVKTCGNDKL